MARHRVLLLLTLGALASTAAFVVPYASGARAATYGVTAVDFKFKGVPSRVTAGKIRCSQVPRPSVVYVLTVRNIDYEWESLKQDFMPLILATVKKAPF